MPPAAAPPLTRRALAALALVGVLTFGAAAAASAQEPPPTTPTSGVLVPGSTAPTTTAPTTSSTTEAPAEDSTESDGILDLDANEKVWVIVGGLVGIAVLMLVLTILYWRHTKPERPKQDRRISKAERKEQKSELKDAKRQRKAAGKDPFTEAVDDDAAALAGPLDIDELLGAPDPDRSVFGPPPEDDDPGR